MKEERGSKIYTHSPCTVLQAVMCGITVTVLSSLTDNATNGGIDLLARRQQLNYYAAVGAKARMDICCFPQILVCFKLLALGEVFKIHEGGYNQPFYINYMHMFINVCTYV